MIFFQLVLCLGLHFAAAATPPHGAEVTLAYTYEQYSKDFAKKGTDSGRALFEQALKDIVSHNAKPDKRYTKGVNAFTDEVATPKGRSPSSEASRRRAPDATAGAAAPVSPGDVARRAAYEAYLADPSTLPAHVDWREVPGATSAVKNQGHCGACWAFATTAVVESHVALASGELHSLSPQQLVACSPNDGHCGGGGGCMGSVPQLAYEYLIGAGFTEEWSYPYVSYAGTTNGTCIEPSNSTADLVKQLAGITGFETLPSNNATAVLAAVAAFGPLAINVAASEWGAYAGGVFDGCTYDDMDINHVVVLEGYGADATTGTDYWLVRNSWSPAWGEHGRIRLLRDAADATPCGVDPTPLDGTGCDGGPPVQYPCGQCGVLFDVSYPTGAFAVYP